MVELRKKQDDSIAKENIVVMPSANAVEKVSGSTSISAPAINTGGRDAIPLKVSGLLGSSSALDLIKKKLQDSGTPTTTSPASVSSVTDPAEINGSTAVEVAVKGSHNGNNKEKLKDASGDGNMSDSSSDSEDGDSGPSKEECIIKFKVLYFFYFIGNCDQVMIFFSFIQNSSPFPGVLFIGRY